ncbi:hypothetical protein [Mycolicibacter sinensis]|uniref:Uncharacterized protein n=1 Tax=Mycolicibacter sinensis (strain JDM601) TaxID=875328 RepID=A0A1A3U4S5_MYCSD|nr:hypothetical protein [Mycolicibacter sinensis]OBK89692.1 hypothetical protein A5648_19620 [Mycolicibacter sinensis]
MTDPIEVNPLDYLAIAAGLPPLPIPPGPVHPGGTSPVDATMAAFGAATNLNLVETNTHLAEDHADRTGHATDAAQKFATNEADAVSKFQDVAGQGDATVAQQGSQEAMGGAMQGMTGAMQGITSALSGALGSVSKLPQGLMQAGQGALSPLMSAAQSLGKAGLGGAGATLASDISPEPGLGGSDFGTGGGGGGGLGMGTTPASNLGPPPVPGTSTPTTPTSSLASTGAAGPTGGTPATGGAGGGGMMPMMPGGAGAGGKGGKDDKAGEKRIAAPGVPNGQPVKGRTTAPPNVPVTKSVAKDAGPTGLTPLKRIVDKDDSSK